MIDKELKTKLSEIVSKHKQMFSYSRSKKEGLIELKNNLSDAPDSSSKLLDELIENANDYTAKNNINDTSEIEELIKNYYSDFMKFCIVGD